MPKELLRTDGKLKARFRIIEDRADWMVVISFIGCLIICVYVMGL